MCAVVQTNNESRRKSECLKDQLKWIGQTYVKATNKMEEGYVNKGSRLETVEEDEQNGGIDRNGRGCVRWPTEA